MALATDVFPGVTALVQNLIAVDPVPYAPANWPHVALKGYDEDEQSSVPESPWCWIVNDTGDLPRKQGPDLAMSEWKFTLRLLADWSNDPKNAQRILMVLLEQIRRAVEAHIKLGHGAGATPPGPVVFAQIEHVDWGFVPVNEVWYRTCDLTLAVVEKEVRNVNP